MTWPVLLAANRDERIDRPWRPPAAHWPELPGVTGGLDVLGGGTWLAYNGVGVVAAVLNRTGSLGPQEGKRSRGELPLMALAHGSAAAAAGALAGRDASGWRSFNAVIADPERAYFVRGLGDGPVTASPLPPGLTMITATEPNDLGQPRIARYLPRFQATPTPNPPDWGAWPELLADSAGEPEAALFIPPANGFGTVSSMLLAVAPGAIQMRFSPDR